MQKKRPRPLPRKMRKKQRPEPGHIPLHKSPDGAQATKTMAQTTTHTRKDLADKSKGLDRAEQPSAPPPHSTKEEAQWKKQYEELNRKHQFLLAEYANYKRQNFKQMENLRKYAGQHLILSLVDKVMDPFDLALQQDLTEQNKEGFKKGMQMIYDNMKTFLKEAGVRESTKKAEPFNPAFHNALDSAPTEDMPPDHILHIIKKAYFFHDKLIRPAEVIVSRPNKKPAEDQKAQQAQAQQDQHTPGQQAPPAKAQAPENQNNETKGPGKSAKTTEDP